MPITLPANYNEPAVQEPGPPCPFRAEHRVHWSEVDLAQIAYTGNIPEYGLRTIDMFWEALLGVNWAQINIDHGISTPFVHLSVDLSSPVNFRSPLVTTLRITKIGNSSVGFAVDGHQSERLCFKSAYVCAFVKAADFTKLPVPSSIRAALERQMELCPNDA